ncbi:hypothetical protein GCM10011390_41840 [Aureimonas endophytica]|uniref:DNA primase/polymerase bifunctional N-terminal domain-containing protein n=1 Tax=Aureimonas endophytica TaxID=2027858 RepID=A0A916ZXT8_9HYPH|nr:bifunctional DNA primase/polymerase [Aureimonas endophytica]GGE18300.1 hypothetical protein GCM10011390_41840 [Aureimonas endophytica]
MTGSQSDEPWNLTVALSLARQGLAVFPVQSGGEKAKRPVPFFRWRENSSTDEKEIRHWWRRWPDAAPALDLAKSGLLVVDADRHAADVDGVEAWRDLMAAHGFEPSGMPVVATPNEGCHFFFRQDGSFTNNRGALPPGIDVRGNGGYVVAPGAIMADGRTYDLDGDLSEAIEVPQWLAQTLAKRGPTPGGQSDADGSERHGLNEGNPTIRYDRTVEDETSADEIAELLSHVPSDCGYDEWIQALMAVHAATGGSSTGFSIADAWSSRGTKYRQGEVAAKWRSFRSSGISLGSLAEISRRYGADLSAIRIAHMPEDRAAIDHGARIADALRASFDAKVLIEHPDGTITTADGEVVDAPVLQERVIVRPAEFPEGLVGDIAQWICDTARRPQPSLALGAALTIVGTAAGRQFVGPTGSGTHLYVLGLAPTGQGKDHALQQIARIMRAAQLGMHVGPSEFISMPAVINFLLRSPLTVCPMDEFGDFMARILHKKASSFERSVAKVLRSMWGISFGEYQSPEWAGRSASTIHAPALSIYGVSTPEQFWRALEGAAIEDGTVNRFTLVGGDQRSIDRDPDFDPHVVPQCILDGLKSIYERSGAVQLGRRNDSAANPSDVRRELPWQDAEAQGAFETFKTATEAKIEDPATSAFYARTVEMAVRIATVVAIGRVGGQESVSLRDIEFGIAMAETSSAMMLLGAQDYLSNSEHQSQAQKIRRIIKSRGGRIQRKALLVAMQHSLRARDLNDLLKAMEEADEIVSEDVAPAAGGPKAKWYRIRV